MFKLLSVAFTLFAISAFAYPEVQLVVPQEEDSYAIAQSAIQEEPVEQPPSQSNDTAAADDRSNETNEAEATAPAAVIRSSSSSSSPSIASRSSYVIASTSIHHHVLPAETFHLPITISTRPGIRTVIAPETITIHQPTVAKVGEVVQQIPTAVSHQSQTIVHKHARVITPIVAPAVRTITSQVVRAYHTPLIYTPVHVINN